MAAYTAAGGSRACDASLLQISCAVRLLRYLGAGVWEMEQLKATSKRQFIIALLIAE